ncbi:hypothetical protein Syun_002402 [Stephania yunnanensis]|uniref:Protein kinase domain-containing protein n=1 Tax=Stephania yunnanensis TaxID=152371 RepID=A0AAP0LFB8_9MAGN
MERLICCANTSAFRRDRGCIHVYGSDLELLEQSVICLLPFLRHFSNEDIRKATGGFGRIVSKNSLGSVYKAHFQDGFVATVKEVNAFHQEKDAFFGYVDVLGRLHHRHIVSLRGFSAGPERFLVFEYAENGSLKDYLRDYISREHRNPIFQLGLLILELITGQSPGKEGTDLVQWVQGSNNTHVVHKMIDPDLGNNYDSKELKDLLTLAKLCTKRGAKPTFSIQQILRYLQMKVESLMPVVPHM